MKNNKEYMKYYARKKRSETRLASCTTDISKSWYLTALEKNPVAKKRFESGHGQSVDYKIPIELCEIHRKLYG